LSVKTGKAQQIITDRPDQTEASSTVPKGSLQIESGILFNFSETTLTKERQILTPTTLFRYGLIKGVEIRILNQFESYKNQMTSTIINGISDLEVGTKIQLLKKENVNTEIAFLSHLVMPTGTSSFSINNFGTINKLSISHQLNSKVGVGYNIGYNYFGVGEGDVTYSLAIGVEVNNRVSFFIEPYGEILNLKNHLSYFDAGFTYLVKNNLQLDFSFCTGVNNKMNFISSGFSWNIH